jgi:hypothetical protein
MGVSRETCNLHSVPPASLSLAQISQPTFFPGRVPIHVRLSVHGPKTDFFQCFHSMLTGSFSWPRLSELIGGVSQKMLTKTLRQMEADGLVSRTVYPETHPGWSTN